MLLGIHIYEDYLHIMGLLDIVDERHLCQPVMALFKEEGANFKYN
jgi:hypothetical protein